jgi:hypothetical protein
LFFEIFFIHCWKVSACTCCDLPCRLQPGSSLRQK